MHPDDEEGDGDRAFQGLGIIIVVCVLFWGGVIILVRRLAGA